MPDAAKIERMKDAGWGVHEHRSHVGPLWAFNHPFGRGDSHLPTVDDAWAAAEEHFDRTILIARKVIDIVDGTTPITMNGQVVGRMTAAAAQQIAIQSDATSVGFSFKPEAP